MTILKLEVIFFWEDQKSLSNSLTHKEKTTFTSSFLHKYKGIDVRIVVLYHV